MLDEQGRLLARQRIPEGLEGLARLHAVLAERAGDPAQVLVGVETDRGLLVGALVAAGYQGYAIDPRAVDRYRDRHGQAGAPSKSDTTWDAFLFLHRAGGGERPKDVMSMPPSAHRR